MTDDRFVVGHQSFDPRKATDSATADALDLLAQAAARVEMLGDKHLRGLMVQVIHVLPQDLPAGTDVGVDTWGTMAALYHEKALHAFSYTLKRLRGEVVMSINRAARRRQSRGLE